MGELAVVAESVVDALTTLLGQRPSVLLAAALALVAVLWSVSWRWTRTVVTIAHEGGHALTAVLAGRGLTGIRLHPDTSGLTVSTGAPAGPGLVFTFLGGYPAPSLLGLGGALLVAADQAQAMIWIALGLLVATLILVRNLFGIVAVVGTGGLVAAVAWWGTPGLQDGFAAALSWFLVFGGLRAVRELQRGRRRGLRGASDVEMLARLTRVPAGMWAGLFWLIAGVAVIGTAWLLLGVR
ncbi:M50 family metallopeptidase [Pseudonocardia sp.]|uniref:M50 family metallopeptidase n=1 Tax=Pseudonocardia sp. TaxID=60912 RepID=UPI00261AF5A2|nr:M50 family metallopeptidase [Pseudonocardia sp.]